MAGIARDTDLLLINRGGVDHQAPVSELCGPSICELEELEEDMVVFPPEVIPPNALNQDSDWSMQMMLNVDDIRSRYVMTACIGKEYNPTKKWATYAYSYDASEGTLSMYIDGELVMREDQRGTPNGNGLTLKIFCLDPGNGGWRRATHLWVRSYRFYGKPLSADQLKANYLQDMDFHSEYTEPVTPDALVVLDARKSKLLEVEGMIDKDQPWNNISPKAYVENLITGSMSDFWWENGPIQDWGDPVLSDFSVDTFLDHDESWGIWKINENKGIGDGGYINTKYQPNINTDWTMEFTIHVVKPNNANNTFLASCPTASGTTVKLDFSHETCSDIAWPPDLKSRDRRRFKQGADS